MSSSSERLKRSWYACLTVKSCAEPRVHTISTSTRFPGCHFLAASLGSHRVPLLWLQHPQDHGPLIPSITARVAMTSDGVVHIARGHQILDE